MSFTNMKSGVLQNSTPLVIDATQMVAPITVSLDTTYAGKSIELSTDGGTLYFTPPYNTSHANQLVIVITAPISHIRLTGQVNDIWSIR